VKSRSKFHALFHKKIEFLYTAVSFPEKLRKMASYEKKWWEVQTEDVGTDDERLALAMVESLAMAELLVQTEKPSNEDISEEEQTALAMAESLVQTEKPSNEDISEEEQTALAMAESLVQTEKTSNEGISEEEQTALAIKNSLVEEEDYNMCLYDAVAEILNLEFKGHYTPEFLKRTYAQKANSTGDAFEKYGVQGEIIIIWAILKDFQKLAIVVQSDDGPYKNQIVKVIANPEHVGVIEHTGMHFNFKILTHKEWHDCLIDAQANDSILPLE
jgi:hypothetical protein